MVDVMWLRTRSIKATSLHPDSSKKGLTRRLRGSWFVVRGSEFDLTEPLRLYNMQPYAFTSSNFVDTTTRVQAVTTQTCNLLNVLHRLREPLQLQNHRQDHLDRSQYDGVPQCYLSSSTPDDIATKPHKSRPFRITKQCPKPTTRWRS
jgi:hypothetical protein